MAVSEDFSRESDSSGKSAPKGAQGVHVDFLQGSLPQGEDLAFLNQWFLTDSESAQTFQSFLNPVREFLGRPAKHVRAHLVFTSYELVRKNSNRTCDHKELLRVLAALAESLHAGSLVIDDIQDASATRRGQPALHSMMGEPAAINAANWLYFWPTDLIRRQNLEPVLELELYRLYHKTMTRAHYGQALDLSYDMTKISQEKAHSISMAAISLKTGALMSMCSEFGAITAGADDKSRQRLSEFGERFGVFLQMYNDLSEYRDSGSAEALMGPFVRPSWVWAVASQMLDSQRFTAFQKEMSGSLDKMQFMALTKHPVVTAAWNQACEYINQSLKELKDHFSDDSALGSIEEMIKKVVEAYG